MSETTMIKRRNGSHGRALRLLSVTSASIATALTAQPVRAQQALDQGPAAVEEIVVTAQKREESLQKVPISIAVLGGPALDEQPAGGTLEALVQVPGISQSTSDAGGMTQVSIRGVSPAVPFGGGSSTVGYYVDSIPFALVRSAAVPNTNAYDMSRVEVLRGPQGTLYGASALNGVVRILTNDADLERFEFKARGGASVTDGGDPSYRADAAINIPVVEDKFAIRLVGGGERQGGWIEQPARNKSDANSSESRNLRIKLAIKPTDNLRIDLSAWTSHEEYDAASYADSAGEQSTPLKQPGETEYDAYNGKVTYDLPFLSITSATSYLDFNQTLYTDASYLAPAIDPALLQLYSDLPAEVFTEELLINSVGDSAWRWSAGLFYRDAKDDRYQTLPAVLPGPISWSDRSESIAVFGELTRSFADGQFELTGGLRYFEDEADTVTLLPAGSFLPANTASSKFDAVTPRVVATWLPGRDLTVYASYSEGFRSGLNQTPLTLLAAPLPPADADRLHNYEFGAKGNLFDGFLSYDAAVYYIDWEDIQQAGSLLYGPPGQEVYISATINGVSASGAGTDLSVTLHPATGLQIGGSISYNDLTQDEDVTQNGIVLYGKGDRLGFSPEYTASAFLDYAFPVGNFDARFNLSASYRSEQILRALGGGGQLQYCTVTGVNLNAFCESGKPLLVNATFDIATRSNQSVSIFVRNLTNWDGLIDPSYSATTPFRTRPRTVGVQFETKF